MVTAMVTAMVTDILYQDKEGPHCIAQNYGHWFDTEKQCDKSDG